MFKKFSYGENVGQANQLKNSVQRGISAAIVENSAQGCYRAYSSEKGITVKLTGCPDNAEALDGG